MTDHTDTYPSQSASGGGENAGPSIPSQASPAESAPARSDRLRLVDVLAADVTPQVEARARQLIAGGDALLVKNARNAVHGFVLDQDHYDTRIEWTPTELNAICPCQTRAGGFVCPHLWATVLLADRSGAFRPLEEARTHLIFSRNGEATDQESSRQREGGASTRKSANAWPARAGWRIHLASIAQSSAGRAAETATFTPGLPRQVVYVVDAAETRCLPAPAIRTTRSQALVIELQSRHQKRGRPRGGAANGSAIWTKPTPIRLDPQEIDSFTDPEDREILLRIVARRMEEPAAPPPAAGPGPAPLNGSSEPNPAPCAARWGSTCSAGCAPPAAAVCASTGRSSRRPGRRQAAQPTPICTCNGTTARLSNSSCASRPTMTAGITP